MPELAIDLPDPQRRRNRRLGGLSSPAGGLKAPLWIVAAAILAYALVTYSGRPLLLTLSALVLGFFALLIADSIWTRPAPGESAAARRKPARLC